VADFTPELYQLVGAVLRDVAQARFNSDVFSRQISFVYEADSLLRRFPVPRVDIDEAEITLHFAIEAVELDPQRSSQRNAAIGSFFDQYSVSIVRQSIEQVRRVIQGIRASDLDDAKKAALATFENRLLSEENLELLKVRLLQYFNENIDRIIDGDCILNEETVIAHLGEFIDTSILNQPEVEKVIGLFAGDWEQVAGNVRQGYQEQVHQLKVAIEKLRDKYPDYKITINPTAAALTAPGMPISSVKIKSKVRNYKWTKVDVDDADLRNVRTLNPE